MNISAAGNPLSQPDYLSPEDHKGETQGDYHSQAESAERNQRLRRRHSHKKLRPLLLPVLGQGDFGQNLGHKAH